MGRDSKIKKSDLKRVVRETRGNVSMMASEDYLNCSRQTIYNLLNHYDLWGLVQERRKSIFAIAESNIFDAVESGDFDASKFVVTHFPGGARWSSKTDVVFSGVQLSDEAMRLMEELGLEPDGVAADFEHMIRELHRQAVGNE